MKKRTSTIAVKAIRIIVDLLLLLLRLRRGRERDPAAGRPGPCSVKLVSFELQLDVHLSPLTSRLPKGPNSPFHGELSTSLFMNAPGPAPRIGAGPDAAPDGDHIARCPFCPHGRLRRTEILPPDLLSPAPRGNHRYLMTPSPRPLGTVPAASGRERPRVVCLAARPRSRRSSPWTTRLRQSTLFPDRPAPCPASLHAHPSR